MSRVEQYLEKIKDVTIVPPVLISILTLDDNNDLSFSRLEKMVQSDQVLVARMLKLANSPFYNRGNKVTNMRQIITLLGFRTVRSMVAMAMADSIFATGNYKKFRDEVWSHSIGTGILGQYICDDFGYKQERDSALVGGLLLDLGKIVLNTIDRKLYIELLTEYLSSDSNIRDLEIRFFGIDHVEMGIAAAKQWNLPAIVIESISERHTPIDDQSELSRILTLSDLIARKAGFGAFHTHHAEEYGQYLDFFNIGGQAREQIHEDYKEKVERDELYKFCSTL